MKPTPHSSTPGRALVLGLVLACVWVAAPSTAAPQGPDLVTPGSQGRDLITATASTAARSGAPDRLGTDPEVRRDLAAHGRTRVFVRYRTQADRATVAGTVRAHGGQLRRQFHLAPMLSAEINERALAALERSAAVVALEPVHDLLPTDDESGQLVHADDVHDLGWLGAGTTIAVLDTGIDNNHPYFTGRLADEACFSQWRAGTEQGLCPNGSATQTGTCPGCGQAGAADALTANCMNGTATLCAHGTHVAGIAAGRGWNVNSAPGDGVASQASLVAVQVFHRLNTRVVDDDTTCFPGAAPCLRAAADDVVAALEWLHDRRAWDTTVTAANLSLGGGRYTSACDTSAYKPAIDALLADGVATVVAAGNDGFTDAVAEPGCVSSAVTVGNTELNDQIAGTSNRGLLVDLYAPGTGIWSAIPDDDWGSMNGTSMAAPQVAGALAVLRNIYPTVNVATRIEHLRASGPRVWLGASTWRRRMDLRAAIETLGRQVDLNSNTNLVRDGGFNLDASRWRLTGAGTTLTTAASGAHGTHSYEGPRYGVATNASTVGSIYQEVPRDISAGETYCASAQVAADGGGSAQSVSLYVWALGGSTTMESHKFSGPLAGGEDWTHLSACVTATGPATAISVQLYFRGHPVAVDAVELHQSFASDGGFNLASCCFWSRSGAGTTLASNASGEQGTTAYEGARYGAASAPATGGSIFQDVRPPAGIQPGDTYCASAQFASLGAGSGGKGSMYVWLRGATPDESSSVYFGPLPGQSRWSSRAVCVTARTSHREVRIEVYPDFGGATLAVDAVQLFKSRVREGGFEAISSEWDTLGATTFSNTTGSGLGTRPAEGVRFARVSTATGGSLYQDVPRTVRPGDTYCASAQVVTANATATGASGALYVWFLGNTPESASRQFGPLPGDSRWTTVGACAVATRSHSAVRVEVYPGAGVTLGLDNVQFGLQPGPKDLMAPTARITAPDAAFTTASTTQVNWVGADPPNGAGLDHFQLRYREASYRTGFGAWQRPAEWQHLTGTSLAATGLRPGLTRCYSVRAVDADANVGAWSAQGCASRLLDDRSLTASAGWTRGTGSGYYQQTYTRTRTEGAVLRRPDALVARVAVRAVVCPSCGALDVFAGDRKVGEVQLRNDTTRRRTFTFPAFPLTTATVRLVVTSSGKPVTIDGVGISRS